MILDLLLAFELLQVFLTNINSLCCSQTNIPECEFEEVQTNANVHMCVFKW